jgi:hypothetical protein
MSKPKKPYSSMTTEELAAATRQFDRPMVIDESRPLTPAERVEWNQLKRAKPGRPRAGEGIQVVSVSIEKSLLRSADRLAKARKVSRASLIADALRLVLRKSSVPAAKKPAKQSSKRRRAA